MIARQDAALVAVKISRVANASIAFVLAVLLFAMLGPSAAIACAVTGPAFTAPGQSNTVVVASCDTRITAYGTWGGLFTVNTGDAFSFYGVGVDAFGNPATSANINTGNATYTVRGDLSTDTYTITLVSIAGNAASDTLSFYTCPGQQSTTTCITTQTTTISITLPQPLALTTASLPGATAGVSYSQTLVAAGGTTPYSYSLSSGTLPPGLSLASNTGAITGTPTAVGSFSVTAKVTDATTPTAATATQALTLTVAAPSITVSPATLTAATVGTAYNQSVSATGGNGAYTYTVAAGALPAGLSLNPSTGAITGTPTAGGAVSFTLRAADATTGPAAPYFGTQVVALTVNAPTIAVTPATLPAGPAGVAYNQTVSASGGVAPYTYAVTSGALPSGVTLAPSTGILSGTPTAAGSFAVTITATDSSTGAGPYSGGQGYTLSVGAATVTVSPGSLPNGTKTAAYSQTITASGGVAPYTYAVTAGSLPAGLTLSSTGALTGTPSGTGSSNFTVTATDSSTGVGAPFKGTQTYSVAVTATITVSPSSFADIIVGTAVSQTVTASGGTGPYTYAVTAGSLPTGLTLSGSGAIAGTVTAAATSNFTITATDSSAAPGPFSGSQSYSWKITAPTLTLSDLPDGQLNQPYDQTLVAGGGTGPYTFQVTAGSLPDGLTLTAAGRLSGLPTTAAAVAFQITATDASPGGIGGPFTVTKGYTVTIAVAPPPTVPALSPTLLGGLMGVLAGLGAGLLRRRRL